MPDVTAALARVDEIFAEFHAGPHSPGLAYGVVADGALVHSAGLGVTDLGPAGTTPDADTVFRIASMTKSFTATSILLLRDRGQLRLDDPVSGYVPELAGLALPTADSPPLTIRHLLTMSGGLPTDDPWGDRQESLGFDDFTALLAQGFRFVAAPGVGFEYSNLGFAILGRVIGNLAEPDGPTKPSEPDGQTAYHRFVRAQVLTPLAMTSTGYVAPDAERRAQGYRRRGSEWVAEPFATPGAFSSMGGLFSSVRDLSTWVLGLLDAFPARDDAPGRHPLARASRREMQQQQRAAGVTATVGIDGPLVEAGSVGYGYGLFVEHLTGRGEVISHSGGYPGFGSHMRWHPASGIGVIALGNGTYTPAERPSRRALDAILQTVAAPARRVVAPWPDTTVAAVEMDSLVAEFDDAVADRHFAVNVDLDVPRDERRAALAGAAESVGPLERATPPDVQSDGPAHAGWTRSGPGGWVKTTVRLSPELEPHVQTLLVAAVPTPPAALSAILERLVAALVDGVWPDGISSGAQLDIDAYLHAAGVARALGGPFELDPTPVSVDDQQRYTFLIRTPGPSWHLVIGLDADGASLASVALKPVPVTSRER